MFIVRSFDHRQRRTMLLASLLLVAPLPLRAQMSGLLKKAAAKTAAQAVGVSGATGAAPTFDDHVLELTDARIASVVAGVQAANGVTGPGGATRAALITRAGSVNEQRNAIIERHDADWIKLQDDERRITMCTSTVLDSLGNVQQAEMEKRTRALAANPNAMNSRLMQDVMQMTMESQRLIAAGDTAAAAQLQRAFARKLGIDPARDSAHAVTRCGRIPAAPRWKQESDSLLALSNSLMRQAQAMDEQAAETGARRAGMTTQQFAIARERIQAYARANGNPSASWRYSAGERKALMPKLQQLKALE